MPKGVGGLVVSYRTNLHLTKDEYDLLNTVRRRIRRGTYCRNAATSLADFVLREIKDEGHSGTSVERQTRALRLLRELLELYRPTEGLRSRATPHPVPVELNDSDTALIDMARGAKDQPEDTSEREELLLEDGTALKVLGRSAFLFLAWKQQAIHDVRHPNLPPSFEEMMTLARDYRGANSITDVADADSAL